MKTSLKHAFALLPKGYILSDVLLSDSLLNTGICQNLVFAPLPLTFFKASFNTGHAARREENRWRDFAVL